MKHKSRLRRNWICRLGLLLTLWWIAVTPVSAISAQSFVVMDALTGCVLSGGNENTKLPMASTTKIMTALLTLEQEDLDQSFTVDAHAIRVEGSSMGLVEGDQVTLRALAYGMLLASGNDAANAAAVRIDGSIEAFAERMNEKAEEIGMKDTHFVTPSGLHEEEHYSTAYDMALLARAALQNPAFAEICRQPKAKLSYGNPPYTRYLTNHNKLLSYYEGCIGVKTGFTKAAGRCLVSAAEKEDGVLVCVTLNAPDDWQDHRRLLDEGFGKLQKVDCTPDLAQTTASVVGGIWDEVTLESDTMQVTLPASCKEELTPKVRLYPFYYAPVRQGDVLGQVEYYWQDTRVAQCEIKAASSVAKLSLPEPPTLWERLVTWWQGLWQ